jgi:hypothetical protein
MQTKQASKERSASMQKITLVSLPPPLPKFTFYRICVLCNLDNLALQRIADQSGVAKSIVDTMFVGTPVERADAEAVLAAFSRVTGWTRNLENTEVPLMDGEF